MSNRSCARTRRECALHSRMVSVLRSKPSVLQTHALSSRRTPSVNARRTKCGLQLVMVIMFVWKRRQKNLLTFQRNLLPTSRQSFPPSIQRVTSVLNIRARRRVTETRPTTASGRHLRSYVWSERSLRQRHRPRNQVRSPPKNLLCLRHTNRPNIQRSNRLWINVVSTRT